MKKVLFLTAAFVIGLQLHAVDIQGGLRAGVATNGSSGYLLPDDESMLTFVPSDGSHWMPAFLAHADIGLGRRFALTPEFGMRFNALRFMSLHSGGSTVETFDEDVSMEWTDLTFDVLAKIRLGRLFYIAAGPGVQVNLAPEFKIGNYSETGKGSTVFGLVADVGFTLPMGPGSLLLSTRMFHDFSAARTRAMLDDYEEGTGDVQYSDVKEWDGKSLSYVNIAFMAGYAFDFGRGRNSNAQ